MKYYVLHHHPDGLIASPSHRHTLFLTGNVLAMIESERDMPLFSLRGQSGEGVRTPWPDDDVEIVLWGFKDAAGIQEMERLLGKRTLIALVFSEVLSFCHNRRPTGDGRWEPLREDG